MTTATQLDNVVTALRAKRDEQKALRAIKWANGFKQEARGHREAAKAYDRAVGLVKRIDREDSVSNEIFCAFQALGEALNI